MTIRAPVRRAAWLVGAALLCSACKSDDPSTPLFDGTTVTIHDAPEDGVLLQDRELPLRATVLDADGVPLPGMRVTWSSSDASRARVSAEGVVTGLALGEVDVRATAGGASDARALSVRAAVPLPATDDASAVSSRLLDGALFITVPPRAVPEGAVLHVRRASDSLPATDRLVEGTAVELGPSGMRFDRDLAISIAVPASIPAAERQHLRMYRVDNDHWARVRDTDVSDDGALVSAGISRAGVYALFRRAEASLIEKADGDNQQAAIGGPVPLAPSVVARDDEAAPVEGVVVRFEVIAGGGVIVGGDSGVSGEDGVAALIGQWRVGGVPGPNTLRARLAGVNAPPVTFTATASAQPRIVVSHPEVNFDGIVGANPTPRFVEIASADGQTIGALFVGPVTYPVGGASGWLTLSIDRVSTPAQLRLAPASASLPPSDYIALVPVRSLVPGVVPDTITVRLGVRHGATTGIVVTRQLGGAVSGNPALVQPRLEFRTASGALAPVNEAVTVEVEDGNGTLRGTLQTIAAGGIATFADLRVDGFGSHRLRFRSGSMSVAGAPFNVTQRLAALHVSVQPGGAVEDRAFTTQPVILLLDEAGIPYQPAKAVTASIASGEGDLEGSRSRNSDDGIARFTNLRIDDEAGPHTLRFSTTNPALSIVSAVFTVAPR